MNAPNNEQLQLFSTPKLPVKSSFYDWEIDQEGVEKSANGSGSSLPQNEANKLQINDSTDNICSDTWICSQAVEASAWQQGNLEESKQPSLLKSTLTLKQSSDIISQESPSTQTLKTTDQNQENSVLLQKNQTDRKTLWITNFLDSNSKKIVNKISLT